MANAVMQRTQTTANLYMYCNYLYCPALCISSQHRSIYTHLYIYVHITHRRT